MYKMLTETKQTQKKIENRHKKIENRGKMCQ